MGFGVIQSAGALTLSDRLSHKRVRSTANNGIIINAILADHQTLFIDINRLPCFRTTLVRRHTN